MKREKLQRFRKKQHLTQAGMAEKLGISTVHYKGIEYNCQNPSYALLCRFRAIYGKEVGDILDLFV